MTPAQKTMAELMSLSSTPERYEDQNALDIALETMPLGELYTKAEEAAEKDTEWGFEDHLVMELLAWFKQWFTWVNEAPCDSCGGKTSPRGGQAALPEEKKYGAQMAEAYWCDKCQLITRFPRYNDAVKLLETRRGRCGEWCNAMTLLLRALGLDVRYIWNSEDHVWNEVYSHKQQRWVHVDSCEQAFDKPLIYTDGWGKKMAYVLAFSTSGATDVTKRYVRRPDMQLPRTRFNEQEMRAILIMKTANLRDTLSFEEQGDLHERDQLEEAEMLSYSDFEKQAELPRQSGSEEWVASRGEAGDAQ